MYLLKFIDNLFKIAVTGNTHLTINKLFEPLFIHNNYCTGKFLLLATTAESRLTFCKNVLLYSIKVFPVPTNNFIFIVSSVGSQ